MADMRFPYITQQQRETKEISSYRNDYQAAENPVLIGTCEYVCGKVTL